MQDKKEEKKDKKELPRQQPSFTWHVLARSMQRNMLFHWSMHTCYILLDVLALKDVAFNEDLLCTILPRSLSYMSWLSRV